MKYIDRILDRISMYRLVLYYLIALLAVAGVFGIFGLIPYSPFAILYLTGTLLGVSIITNIVFSRIFEAPVNVESVYITALILALILKPTLSLHSLAFWGWAAVLAMASKYILALNRKHIFNPAAIAVVLTALGLEQSATWWVGNAIMMPFVVIGGLLIVRKIRRSDLVFWFFITAAITILGFTVLKGGSLTTTVNNFILHSSLLFFAFVMLTEPLTTPATKKWQSIYGAFVGFLFAPQVHIGSVFSTPELALVVGNVFSYIVSPKQKFFLYLKEKIHVSSDIIDFVFKPKQKLAFTPGQYMEWTLQHTRTDSRGNRRYFTIASSPTEDTLRLGVRFSPHGSSYKKAMKQLDGDQLIVGAQLAGDFILPSDLKEKLVFMAGGIGVTPFRSMLKYLIDTNEKRDITMIYTNKTVYEIAYKEIFTEAEEKLGIKTLYTLTDKSSVPPDWTGRVGRIDTQMIQDAIPDFADRMYYLSGPLSLVSASEDVLKQLGIKESRIKKDFFPGLV